MSRPVHRPLLAALVASAALLAAAPAAPAAIPSNAEIRGYVKDLTSHGYRRTGTEAGQRAAEYMVRRFKEFGLKDAHVETVGSYLWEASRWGLEAGGTPIDAFPVAHSFLQGDGEAEFSTGADGLTAPLVDVGDGKAADFAKTDVNGKIVVFDLRFLVLKLSLFQAASSFYWDPKKTLDPGDSLEQPYISNIVDVVTRAMAGGAVGFVGVLADYFDSNRYFNELYRRVHMRIPGMWVTRTGGAQVRSALASAPATATATIRLEGRRRAVTGRTAIGFLPGRSKETVLVQSHHDSVWDGAVEDGSGSAEVLALAKHFGAQPARKRKRTLMFTTFDTHFTGYQAHQQFLRDYVQKHPQGRRIVANVAIEHIGRRATVVDGKLVTTKQPEPRGILQNTSKRVQTIMKNAIKRNDLRRTALLPAALFGGEGIPTDASFNYNAGIPVMSLIAGPMYLYDAADTLDKVMTSDLAPMARAFAEIVTGLDAVPAKAIGDGVPIKHTETAR
jgi:hypothetical protein